MSELPPPVILWWWRHVKIDLKPNDYICVVDENHTAAAHLTGWLEESPNILFCYSGDGLTMGDLANEIQTACNHPCPEAFTSVRMENMVDHVQNGIALYVEDVIERMRSINDTQEIILSIKDQQYERKVAQEEEKKRKAEERAKTRASKKTKKEKDKPKAPTETVPDSDEEEPEEEKEPGTQASQSQPSQAAPRPRTKVGGRPKPAPGMPARKSPEFLKSLQTAASPEEPDTSPRAASPDPDEEEESIAQRAAEEADALAAEVAAELGVHPPPRAVAALAAPRSTSPRARSSSSSRSDSQQRRIQPVPQPPQRSPAEMLRDRLSQATSKSRSRSPGHK